MSCPFNAGASAPAVGVEDMLSKLKESDVNHASAGWQVVLAKCQQQKLEQSHTSK